MTKRQDWLVIGALVVGAACAVVVCVWAARAFGVWPVLSTALAALMFVWALCAAAADADRAMEELLRRATLNEPGRLAAERQREIAEWKADRRRAPTGGVA